MARASLPSFYEILGVEKEADAAEVKRAYRQASRSAHPDTGGNPALFHLLTVAYETLSDPVRRRDYDQSLGSPGVAGRPSEAELQNILLQHTEELRVQWEAEQRRREAALAAEMDARNLQRLHAMQQGRSVQQQRVPTKEQKRRLLLVRTGLYAATGALAALYYLLRSSGALSFLVPDSGPVAQFHEVLSGTAPGLVFLFFSLGLLAEHFFEPAARIYVLKDQRLRLPVALTASGLVLVGELLVTNGGKLMAAGMGVIAAVILVVQHLRSPSSSR